MVIKGYASALIGVEAKTVTVEANATTTPDFNTFIIGLPDVSVKESLFRCDAAIRNSGFEPLLFLWLWQIIPCPNINHYNR